MLTRRRLILRSLGGAAVAFGVALLFPLRSLGPSPSDRELDSTPWSPGKRLVNADGTPVKSADVPLGGLVTVFPEGAVGSETGQAVLVRVDPSLIKALPGRAGWTPEGLLAYSKVCTHAGCPVGLYEARSQSAALPVPSIDLRRAPGRPAHLRTSRGAPPPVAARRRRRRDGAGDGRVQQSTRSVVLEPATVSRLRRAAVALGVPAAGVLVAGCSGHAPSMLHTGGSEAHTLSQGVVADVRARARPCTPLSPASSSGRCCGAGGVPVRAAQRRHVDRVGRHRGSRRHPGGAGGHHGAGHRQSCASRHRTPCASR